MSATTNAQPSNGPAAPLGSDPWFTPRRFGVFLGVALLTAFPKVVFGSHTFFYRDFGVLAYPMIAFHRECFWRGEFPLWNPLSNCGAPFMAQWGTMALYPFSLFYLVLPLPWSLNFFCLAHLFLAGIGMYFLAQRWTDDRFAASVAGTVFVFSGVTLSCLMWPNYAVALGWMPWVVLRVEQAWKQGGRKLIAAALLASLQMLSGVPEIVVLTWLLLLGIWMDDVLRRAATPRLCTGRALAVVLLVSGLTAAQLLPFFDLLAHSQRHAEFATSKWAMPAWGWVNLLVPLFRCFLTPQGIFFQVGQEFLSSTYLGVTALLLGIFAVWAVRERRVWLLAGAAVFALAMALGGNGPVYSWFKQALPLLGFARYPIKFIVLAAFVFPLLAAYGVRLLRSGSPARHGWLCRSLCVVCGGLLFAIVLILGFTSWHPMPFDRWPAILWCGTWRAVFLIATVGLLIVLAWMPRPAWQRAVQVGLLTLVVLDVLTHIPHQNPTLPTYALAPGLWELHHKTAPPKVGYGRVMISPRAEQHLLLSGVPDLYSDLLGKRLALWSNLNLLEGIPKVNGSSTLQVAEQREVQSLLYAATNRELPRLADFLAVSEVTTPGQIVEWTRRETALPWVTGGQRPIYADAAETLRALTNTSFNAKEVVYLPDDPRPVVTVTNRTDVKVRPVHFSGQQIEFEMAAPEPSLVVIAQTFHPNWRAYVDGAQRPIWRANHAFQALQAPAGTHTVRLVYEDRRFRYGAGISAATLLLCFFLWFAARDSNSSGEPTPPKASAQRARKTGESE